jgi:hypothetical protein
VIPFFRSLRFLPDRGGTAAIALKVELADACLLRVFFDRGDGSCGIRQAFFWSVNGELAARSKRKVW